MVNEFILASSSPRRRDLLKQAGYLFQVKAADIDETPLRNETPQNMVKRLSVSKAKVIAESEISSAKVTFILAADTTVVSSKGKNLGKPESIKEAEKMISNLQGKAHQVFTAYTLLKIKNGKLLKSITRLIRTDVWIKKMNSKEVKSYVALGECLDKAGAYAAQGFGMVLIEKIKGSYTNVVGLPMTQVVDDLKKLGFEKNG